MCKYQRRFDKTYYEYAPCQLKRITNFRTNAARSEDCEAPR